VNLNRALVWAVAAFISALGACAWLVLAADALGNAPGCCLAFIVLAVFSLLSAVSAYRRSLRWGGRR